VITETIAAREEQPRVAAGPPLASLR
jgi:hypothetical protein